MHGWLEMSLLFQWSLAPGANDAGASKRRAQFNQ
jgi:hypothetical protein